MILSPILAALTIAAPAPAATVPPVTAYRELVGWYKPTNPLGCTPHRRPHIRDAIGIATSDPRLPCGTKLRILWRGKTHRVRVIDTCPTCADDAQFPLTFLLTERLKWRLDGFWGTQLVIWERGWADS
ncbi:MAG: hypothetical protein H0X39_15670 [Actinobacteria bacterium]|nr:hypothetical protein [Actinomycetota bacterium]